MSWESLQRAVRNNHKISFEKAKKHYEQITTQELYRLRENARRYEKWFHAQEKFLELDYEKMRLRPLDELRYAFIDQPRDARMPGAIVNLLIKMDITKICDIKQYHINAIPQAQWREALVEALEFIETRIIYVYCTKGLFNKINKKPHIKYIHITSLNDIKDKHIIIADNVKLDITSASKCKSISVLDRSTLKTQRFVVNQTQPLKDMQCLKPQPVN